MLLTIPKEVYTPLPLCQSLEPLEEWLGKLRVIRGLPGAPPSVGKKETAGWTWPWRKPTGAAGWNQHPEEAYKEKACRTGSTGFDGTCGLPAPTPTHEPSTSPTYRAAMWWLPLLSGKMENMKERWLPPLPDIRGLEGSPDDYLAMAEAVD